MDNANETLTDERLREKGLEDNTIQAIREGDYDEVSEAEARRASAVLKLGTGEWAHAGSSANCCIYWHWEDKPLNLWTDTVSSSITNGFDVTANSTCKVGYGDLNSMSSDQDARFDLVPSTEEDPIPNHIARFDFPLISLWLNSRLNGQLQEKRLLLIMVLLRQVCRLDLQRIIIICGIRLIFILIHSEL